jgi:Tfp pilus assembly protein PilF
MTDQPNRASVSVDTAVQIAASHHRQGNIAEAESIYRQILAQAPNRVDVLQLLGVLLHSTGQPGGIEMIRRAIQVDPTFPAAHNNLGNLLQLDGQFVLAATSYRRALALKPDYPEALNNLGKAEQSISFVGDAETRFRRAIELRPDFAAAHHNLGLLLLLTGRYEEGWREHEWRWRKPDYPTKSKEYPQPAWDGSDSIGKTILVYTEQGVGDSIHFVRYIPDICLRGAKVILECTADLQRLYASSPSLSGVTIYPATLPPMPPPKPFDFHVPLMSLPLVLKMYDPAQSVPIKLSPDPKLINEWRSRIPPGDGWKVGVCWAGNPRHQNDLLRSIPAELLAPLAMPGVRLFSLQKGRPAMSKPPMIDLTEQFTDFADTAALISHLDLVITVDTAVAHLAATMGKPVWLLLPVNPDFRWDRHGETTPWYPTMRLFRRESHLDWPMVISRVAAELSARRPPTV